MYRLLIFLLLLGACTARRSLPAEGAIRFAGSYTLPYGLKFWGTTVGGFSGIDYDSSKDRYYILSDDGSKLHNTRYYSAAIRLHERGIQDVQLENVVFLHDSLQAPFAYGTVDPEGLRFHAGEDLLYWSSEGERTISEDSTRLIDPAIYVHTRDGKMEKKLPLPPLLHMQMEEKGPRHNGSFEGLSFSVDRRNLYVALEEPLYEDGPRAATGDSGAIIRLIRYDMQKGLPDGQYAYPIDPVARVPQPAGSFKVNGVSEILALGKDSLLVMERSFSTGFTGCVVRVYLAVLPPAAQPLNHQGTLPLLRKQLLIDMQQLPVPVYNVEGMCFGPRLQNGNRSLLFVADDNFSTNDRTQFLLFEINERKSYF